MYGLHKKYYHVSKEYLGESVTLTPRIPGSSVVSIEGTIPRICVSDSLYLCLRSITGNATLMLNEVLMEFECQDVMVPFEPPEVITERRSEPKLIFPSVYARRDTPYLPPKASDFRSNGEMWFLEPTEFQLEGYIDLKWLVEKEQIRLIKKPGYISTSYTELGEIEIKKQKHVC